MPFRLLVPLALAVLLALRPSPAVAARVADASPRAAPPSSLVAETTHFAFHSHPWVHLHLLLREWARRDDEAEGPRPNYPLPERRRLADLPAADRAAWKAALDAYAARVLTRSRLFDDDLAALRARLAAHDPAAATAPADLPVDVARALNAAMPVFRAHWWEAHDAASRAWIATADSLLRRHEAALAPRAARAYGGRWPDAPIRVDVAAVSNWIGAYSTDGHVFMGHRRRQADERHVLETLLHEAAHVPSMERALKGRLREAFAAEGVALPDRLWHAIIFYTSGALTRDAVAEASGAAYTPYAVARGLWERVYDGAKPVLDAHWRPYVLGRTDDRAAAFRAIARAWGDRAGDRADG